MNCKEPLEFARERAANLGAVDVSEQAARIDDCAGLFVFERLEHAGTGADDQAFSREQRLAFERSGS